MEEVDNIVIHTLRQIGCSIDDKVESLKDFTTELVVEGVVKCLLLIKPSLDLPRHVPPSMAARYRVGATLASTCMEEGYSGEIGYQTFLYSNESEIRKIFLFLLEKLPKENEKTVDEPLGTAALIRKAIAENLATKLKLPWMPTYCKLKGIRFSSPTIWHREGFKDVSPLCTFRILTIPPDGNKANIPKALKDYYAHHMKLVNEQVPDHRALAPSLFESNVSALTKDNEWETEWNLSGLASRLTAQEYKKKKKDRLQKKIEEQLRQTLQGVKLEELSSEPLQRVVLKNRKMGSRFTHAEKLQFTKESENLGSVENKRPNSEEEMRQSREEEIKRLQDELDSINSQLDKFESQVKQLSAAIQQMTEVVTTEKTSERDLQDMYHVKKRTFDLLPDAENNLKKLQSVVEASTQRLVSLAAQWEKFRAPLIEEYRQLREANSQQLDETQRKLEEIKMLREKMREIGEDGRTKEQLCKQLKAECEKLTKDINRSAYTRRIIEIVGNIKKQKAEIDKVLLDTKSIQKEINMLSGKLDRTFTVTDELIFKDAKKDEAVRKSYKHLAALHENCNQLIHTVEETGVILREIRELEDQIEQESQKKVGANLERITADKKHMKQENAALMNQLKEK